MTDHVSGEDMYGPSARTRIAQTATALLLLLAAGTVGARESAATSHLHLQITRDGKFEVFASRAKSGDTAIAIALLGFVGYGIVTSSKSENDTERERQVAPDAGPRTCRIGFEQALSSHLEKKGFAIEAEPDETLPVLEVAIVSCGFRTLDRSNGDMSAFFETKFRFTQAGARRSRKPQRLFETGKLRAAWSEYENSPALAADELQLVLSRAGQKLANKIVYSREN